MNRQLPDTTDFEAEAFAEHAGLGLEAAGTTTYALGLLGRVPEGGELPPWHGAWRFNMGHEYADTAVVGLNILLAMAWRTWGWIKLGGRMVSPDPRQAFVDGLNAGHERAVQELPDEVRNMRDMAIGKQAQAERMASFYTPTLKLRENFVRLTQFLQSDLIDKLEPAELRRELRRAGETLQQQIDAVIPETRDANPRSTNEAGPPAA